MNETAHQAAARPAERPAFVLGADHSGTTILYRMLAYHPDLAWFSQFSPAGGLPGGAKERLYDSIDRRLRGLPHDWRKDPRLADRVRRRFVPFPEERPAIWDPILDPGSPAERLRHTLVGFSERMGDRRVLAKRPAFNEHLGRLAACFPEARYVHIVRDGRAVALSLTRKALGRDPGLSREKALERSARFWVEVLDRIAGAGGVKAPTLRYERLCEDVHATLREALTALDLDADRFPFERCPKTLSVQNTKWTERASAKEIARIEEIQAPVLERYGYAV